GAGAAGGRRLSRPAHGGATGAVRGDRAAAAAPGDGAGAGRRDRARATGRAGPAGAGPRASPPGRAGPRRRARAWPGVPPRPPPPRAPAPGAGPGPGPAAPLAPPGMRPARDGRAAAGPGRWRPAAALRRASPVLLVAAALAVPAALAAGAVPWWQAEPAGGVFALTSLGVLAAAAALVAGSPAFRHTLGLIAAAAGVAAAAVGADLLTGSWLQLNSVVGYSAHDGRRYIGLGDINLGVLIASTLLVAGCLAEQVPRRHRPLVVVAVGVVGVVLAG